MQNFLKRRSGVLLILLLTLTVTSGCVTARIGVNWPMVTTMADTQNIFVAYNNEALQIDPRTGNLAELTNAEGEARIDPNSGQVRRWRIDGSANNGAQFFGAPLPFTDETLLLPEYSGRLVEVEIDTARVMADKGTVSGRVLTSPVSDGERIYVPLGASGLEAIDAATLEQVWFITTENGVWDSPVLHNGVLYFTSMDHSLYAVDAVTGEEIWKRDLGGAAAASPLLVIDGAVAESEAENAAETNTNTETETQTDTDTESSDSGTDADSESTSEETAPAASQGEVSLYVGTFSRKVIKFDLEGVVQAEYATVDWLWSTPVLFDGTLYTADLAGYVYALDPEDLSEIWKVKAMERGIRPSPLVTEAYVVVAARDGLVKWLDRANGQTQFERATEAEVLSELLLIEPSETLALPEPLVIVSTVAPNRLLLAYTLNEGGQQWVYPPQ